MRKCAHFRGKSLSPNFHRSTVPNFTFHHCTALSPLTFCRKRVLTTRKNGKTVQIENVEEQEAHSAHRGKKTYSDDRPSRRTRFAKPPSENEPFERLSFQHDNHSPLGASRSTICTSRKGLSPEGKENSSSYRSLTQPTNPTAYEQTSGGALLAQVAAKSTPMNNQEYEYRRVVEGGVLRLSFVLLSSHIIRRGFSAHDTSRQPYGQRDSNVLFVAEPDLKGFFRRLQLKAIHSRKVSAMS